LRPLLEAVGNEINNYSAINFCTGATDIYIARQVASGSANRDPSWYTLPAFHDTVWFDQRETSPAIVSKVIYFNFTMSRNWTEESLRGFHFLPKARAAALAHNHFNYSRDDLLLLFRGLAVTYGAIFDGEYQSVFQEMHSHICNEQIGQSYPFTFMEAAVNDWFFRVATAARNPRAQFMLPGYSEPQTTLGYTPRQWADVFRAGFYSLVEQIDNPLHFQTYTLRRVGQPAYPMPMHKPSKGTGGGPSKRQGSDRQGSDHTPITPSGTGGAHTPASKGRGRTPPSPANGPNGSKGRLCFISFLRHYKVNLKSTNALPKKCESTCTRLHYADLPSDFTKAAAMAVAKATTLVTEENRAAIESAISADSKLK
jgi:hypothetical protein